MVNLGTKEAPHHVSVREGGARWSQFYGCRETEARRCPANTCLGVIRASHTTPMPLCRGLPCTLGPQAGGQHPRMQCAVPGLGSLQITTNPNCQGLWQTPERDVPEPGTTWFHQDRRMRSLTPAPHPLRLHPHLPKGPIKRTELVRPGGHTPDATAQGQCGGQEGPGGGP